MNFRFYALSLSFLLLGSCGPSQLTNFEWSRKSDSPLHAPEVFQNSSEQNIQNKFNKIAFAQQKIGNYDVEGTFLKKVQSSNGEMVWARANYIQQNIVSQKELSFFEKDKETATNKIKDKFLYLKKYEIETFDVVITQHHRRWIPAWRIIYIDLSGFAWKMLLDKNYNLVSVNRVGSQFHDALALVFPMGPRKSPLQEVLLQNLLVDGSLSSDTMRVNTLSPSKILTIGDALKFSPPDERFDQVQVFYIVHKSFSWFVKNLNMSLLSPVEIQLHIGYPDKTNAAFYYGGKIRLGAGDDVVYSKIPQDPSIVTHETCHAFIDQTAHLPFDGEGGSINEGYADFITALQYDNPLMGEVAYLKGPYKRTTDNEMTLTDKNGGLYHDSAIVSGLLWELKKVIGGAKALEIAIKTLNLLSPASDLNDFKKHVIESVDQTVTGNDLEKAKGILIKRGF